MVSSLTPVPISIRNILLPTDFSPSSAKALAVGASIARHFGARLNIVTVVPEVIVDYVQPPDPFYFRHAAEKKMAQLAEEGVLRGIAHREFVKDGQISEMIPLITDRLGIDLVVLGVHIQSRVKQLVVGSAAEEIIHLVPCSIIAIGPNARKPSASQWELQRILYAIDLRADSGEALAYCLCLGEREHARLTLLHVHRPSSRAEIQESNRKEILQRVAQFQLRESTLQTELTIDGGDPGDQIVKNAEERDVGLIVLGPCDSSATWKSTHLPWAISHQVICHAHCPVLLVHHCGRKRSKQYS